MAYFYHTTQPILSPEGSWVCGFLYNSYLHLCRYFDWVKLLDNVIIAWQERAQESALNYNDILMYISVHRHILSICDAIDISCCGLQHTLEKKRKSYLALFEHLNLLLLRYFPGKPEICTLSSILAENGMSFPPELAGAIAKYVEIPGEHNQMEGSPLQNEMQTDTTQQLSQLCSISMKLSKRLVLKDLEKLVSDLEDFLLPIVNHIDMLVFFKLHSSTMFKEYLKLYLGKEIEFAGKQNPIRASATSTCNDFPSFIQEPAEAEEEPKVKINLEILAQPLDKTKKLLIKLAEGSATYNEIIAEGRLDLQNLDIDTEFHILNEFTCLLKHTFEGESGLKGVRCMLELFQYQSHILKIHGVCKQYMLKHCQDDPCLKQLVDLAEEISLEDSRRKLTLSEATEKVFRVKQLLFGDKKPSNHCLKLFDAVADSAAFYNFIKDNKFSGSQGQAVFTQQYELITAQLQHEKYDEQVLNHLFAAYKFMLPFMNSEQNFRTLMDAVVKIDTSNGLKELETVNSNIDLIQLWFSRAEV